MQENPYRQMSTWWQYPDSSRLQQMQPWSIQQIFSVSHCLSIIHVFCTTISVPPHARSPVDGHSNSSSNQKQHSKPRQVHNPSTRVSQADSEDTFSLPSRITYPAVPSMDVEMVTASGLEHTAADAAMDPPTNIQCKLSSIYHPLFLHDHFSAAAG